MSEQYVVTTPALSGPDTYYLRGTIWSSQLDRADTFSTVEAATVAVAKSAKFNPKLAKKARVVKLAEVIPC